MNKSIVSLCQEWQTYQLPTWQSRDESSVYAESIKKILQLAEELASVRAYLRLIHQQRLKLAGHALRWNINGDPQDVDYCWNCYFYSYSFSKEVAPQIIKTLKTFLYKETLELRSIQRLEDSQLLKRLLQLPDGLLNWKLATGFGPDLIDVLKAVKIKAETTLDPPPGLGPVNYAHAEMIVTDLTQIVLPVLRLSPEERKSMSSLKKNVADQLRDTVLQPCGVKIETYTRVRFEKDRAAILELMRAHYRRVEVNLSDYLKKASPADYEPSAEIVEAVQAFRRHHDSWLLQLGLWTEYVSPPAALDELAAAVGELLEECKENLGGQLRTLERIRRRSLDKSGMIERIVAADRESWLMALSKV